MQSPAPTPGRVRACSVPTRRRPRWTTITSCDEPERRCRSLWPRRSRFIWRRFMTRRSSARSGRLARLVARRRRLRHTDGRLDARDDRAAAARPRLHGRMPRPSEGTPRRNDRDPRRRASAWALTSSSRRTSFPRTWSGGEPTRRAVTWNASSASTSIPPIEWTTTRMAMRSIPTTPAT